MMKPLFQFTAILCCTLLSKQVFSQAQAFELHVEAYINGQGSNALLPADNGFINLCPGDSVLLVAKPLFPNSLEATGSGYSQTTDNVLYEWLLPHHQTQSGNDSIWFKPTIRMGYQLVLNITDSYPQTISGIFSIRVGQLPQFPGLGPEINPACLLAPANLIGGLSATDTVGVMYPEGYFHVEHVQDGLTYLPDGTGAVYSTALTINGFDDAAVVSQAADLQSVCVTMEHSYLGDLEIWLTCPDGTEVALVNSYNAGHITGGFEGGGTLLGDAFDGADGVPGTGWEYCFSGVNNTWGTMGDELAAENMVPASFGNSMNPDGIYLPESSFAGFIGCPLNGDWTIHIQDNQGIDDGFVFGWNIEFNDVSYQNYAVDAHWMNDPTIISGINDTAIVVSLPSTGDYDYTFVVTDNYGCINDTTVTLTVHDIVTLSPVSALCDTASVYTFTEGSPGGGSYYLNGNEASFIDPGNSPVGEYELVYSNGCSDTATFEIIHCIYASLTENEINSFQIYPNPSGGIVHVLFPEDIEKCTLILRDASAREIRHYQMSETIDLSGYGQGMYSLEILGQTKGYGVYKISLL